MQAMHVHTFHAAGCRMLKMYLTMATSASVIDADGIEENAHPIDT